jgi:hypothetical protein
VEGLFTQAGSFELGIWHPFALSHDKQDRESYKMLRGPTNSYRSGVSRAQRQEAIDAIRSFVDEAQDLIAALPEAESGLSSTSDPLLLTIPPLQTVPELERLSVSSEMALASREEATIIAVGSWTVRAFVETTRASYGKIKEGGSARCGCDNCSNFVQARDQAYPPEILSWLEALGIDFRKESEVHYYGRTSAGFHTYRGWFYLAGLIDNARALGRFRVGSRFEIGLNKKSDFGFSEWETILIDAGFADGPVVEVDFYADLPWISEASEPME